MRAGNEAAMKSIQEKLDLVISKFDNGAFVRLSTRSPKDAVDKCDLEVVTLLLKDELKKELGLRELKNSEDLDLNSKLKLILNSYRTISDMIRAIDNIDVSPWSLKIVVREFVQIPIESEFRGIVYRGQLNALSQYYADTYFDSLDPSKYSTIIQQFFQQQIKEAKLFEEKDGSITLESYIMDFAVLPTDEV